jgi:hypothetical protein
MNLVAKVLKMIFVIFLVSQCISSKAIGQDTLKEKDRKIVYTLLVNHVPDQFNFPLIGFVNIAKGSHKGFQLGFFNSNQSHLDGSQISFINSSGSGINGLQLGFINTCIGNMKGMQTGFINTAIGNVNGSQLGFVNTSIDYVKGIQLGFTNTTIAAIEGAQIGFINTANNVNGFQLGFVNTTKKVNGFQLGFVNTTKNVNGFQLGFVNLSDTLNNGIPFGFLSIVKKGGYRAFEISSSEMYPVNLAYKIGVKKLYTSFIGSYNAKANSNFSVGLGVGSILPISNTLNFNPELSSQSQLNTNNNQVLRLSMNFDYLITSKIYASIGPSIVWNYKNSEDTFEDPFFALYKNQINENNRIILGAKISLKYVFAE